MAENLNPLKIILRGKVKSTRELGRFGMLDVATLIAVVTTSDCPLEISPAGETDSIAGTERAADRAGTPNRTR